MIKFYLPESADLVDPGFDFLTDSYSTDRAGPEDDVYAHELFGSPQCDGILVTRSLISPEKAKAVQRAGGVKQYLRLPKSFPVIADCGAFQYRDAEFPPYTCEETCEFYEQLGFDYGISLDHMIFDFDPEYDAGSSLLARTPTPEMERRFRLSLDNAKRMRQICVEKEYAFHLIGGVQGWSPESYHNAVKELIEDGFDYVALGGLARANDEQLKSVLEALRETVVSSGTRLHILGVARLSLLEDYVNSNVASCDSASALLQAFKSNKDNYHTKGRNYTAVRIPPASGDLSPKVRKLLKNEVAENGEEAGASLHRELIQLEQEALKNLRAYDAGELPLEEAMASLIAYEDRFGDEKRYYPLFEETLRDRPWSRCPCKICRSAGIEVIIMRGNNRNRRRGFHNTWNSFQRFKVERDRFQRVVAIEGD